MHWIPFDRILGSALRLHRICDDSAPSIQQWSVLPTLFLKYGKPGNRLLHRCRRILLRIPVDERHFSSAGIHTGQSTVVDTTVRNGIPTSSFYSRLCVRHGLQAPASRLPGWRDRNTILYADNHKGWIDIPLPDVCTSLPCSALWSADYNAGIPALTDREELHSHTFHWWSQHPGMVIPDSHAVTPLDDPPLPCVVSAK